MTNLLQNISLILWTVLAILVFVQLRKWNKKFSDLYDELKEQIEDDKYE